MVKHEKMVAYYGPNDWLSSFYRCAMKITVLKGRDPFTVVSAEHAFHMCKAAYFRDYAMINRIANARTPHEALQLGRRVSGFDEVRWNEKRKDAMKYVMRAKLNSNKKLYAAALSLKGHILVEASPRNRVWGIGLSKDNPDVFNPSRWYGDNLHGECWMEVIQEL